MKIKRTITHRYRIGFYLPLARSEFANLSTLPRRSCSNSLRSRETKHEVSELARRNENSARSDSINRDGILFAFFLRGRRGDKSSRLATPIASFHATLRGWRESSRFLSRCTLSPQRGGCVATPPGTKRRATTRLQRRGCNDEGATPARRRWRAFTGVPTMNELPALLSAARNSETHRRVAIPQIKYINVPATSREIVSNSETAILFVSIALILRSTSTKFETIVP